MIYSHRRRPALKGFKFTLFFSAGLLPIILGVAGALLLLLIVLAVVCVLKK